MHCFCMTDKKRSWWSILQWQLEYDILTKDREKKKKKNWSNLFNKNPPIKTNICFKNKLTTKRKSSMINTEHLFRKENWN